MDGGDRRRTEVHVRTEKGLADPVLLRVPAVARQLSIGRSRVYELIEQGQLRRVKLGRTALIPAADVESLVARLTSDAGRAREGAVRE